MEGNPGTIAATWDDLFSQRYIAVADFVGPFRSELTMRNPGCLGLSVELTRRLAVLASLRPTRVQPRN